LDNLYSAPVSTIGHKIRVTALALFLVVTSIDAQADDMGKFQVKRIDNSPLIEKVEKGFFSNSFLSDSDITVSINQIGFTVLVRENPLPWQRKVSARKLQDSFYENFDDNQDDIDRFLPMFKAMSRELSRLPIEEVFVDVSRKKGMIDFNLSMQEGVFLSVAKTLDETSDNVMFSIARNHNTLVIDEMPLRGLMKKVVNVVAQLKTLD
jgi:hypothetical protein